MSTIRNAVMGLMLASTVFAVGCNKADDTASASPETATATAPVQQQAQATTTVATTPASATVSTNAGVSQYSYASSYQRGVRSGERVEAQRIARERDPGFYRGPREVVVERPVVERPIRREVIVNRPVIERPGFFVRFANWRHNHGCKF